MKNKIFISLPLLTLVVAPALVALAPEKSKAFDKAIFQRNPLIVQEILKQEPKLTKEELTKMKEIAEDELNKLEYPKGASPEAVSLQTIIYYLKEELKAN